LSGTQGAFGLVDEEEEIVGLVEAAEGLVLVVCAKAPSEIKQRTASINTMLHCEFRLRTPSFRFPALRGSPEVASAFSLETLMP
jgi:hypothetical protein